MTDGCQVCGADDDCAFVQCGQCEIFCHLGCLQPHVSQSCEWYCTVCAGERAIDPLFKESAVVEVDWDLHGTHLGQVKGVRRSMAGGREHLVWYRYGDEEWHDLDRRLGVDARRILLYPLAIPIPATGTTVKTYNWWQATPKKGKSKKPEGLVEAVVVQVARVDGTSNTWAGEVVHLLRYANGELHWVNKLQCDDLPMSGIDDTAGDDVVLSDANVGDEDEDTDDFNGVVKDLLMSSGNTPSTCRGYMSAHGWVVAALLSTGHKLADLVDQNLDANNELAASVHTLIADWFCKGVTTDQVGIQGIASRQRKLPKECLSKARNFMYTYINARRAMAFKPTLDTGWGKQLAGHKLSVRAVTTHAVAEMRRTGTLFHDKKDFAPNYEILERMTYCGWTGTDRVHGNILHSVEAGMAIAVYLLTGARGSELKKMVLQDMGWTEFQDCRAGETFMGLRLMAHLNKTSVLHLNELMCHSHPWLCGVGLVGLSILIRIKTLRQPPPFKMGVDEETWHLFGTSVSTLDSRINEIYMVAAAHTENGDPVTYLGRHLGTRLLSDQGGSKDGGEARTGHHSGGTARKHYMGMPAQDKQRLTGTLPEHPRLASHLHGSLNTLSDAVIAAIPGFAPIFFELETIRARLETINTTMNAVDGKRARTAEQLCTRERYLMSIVFACRTAVCCLVARPRTWKRWVIEADKPSIWERQRRGDTCQRAATELFGTHLCPTMNALANGVRELEDIELQQVAQMESPHIASLLAESRAAADARAALRLERQIAELHIHYSRREAAVLSFTETLLVLPLDRQRYDELRTQLPTIATSTLAPIPAPQPSPLHAAHSKLKAKKQRVVQDATDENYTRPLTESIKQGETLMSALAYAKDTLVPREARSNSWRIASDGTKTASHARWTEYKMLAAAVGYRLESGDTYDQALEQLEVQLQAASSCTSFLRTLRSDDKMAKFVLGLGPTTVIGAAAWI